MLKRVPIRLKLMLLAGVPVLGALVLAMLITRAAQREAESAAALGSIEDLAQLSAEMSSVVHALQFERDAIALETGTKSGDKKALEERFTTTDAARRHLGEFLAARSVAALPERLARDLAKAEEGLRSIEKTRSAALDGSAFIDQTLAFYQGAIRSLISATAALAQLTDDGQMMRAISALVTVLEVKERASQEHAVLSHVFAISQFPAGVYKDLVTLITEEAAYVRVLEVNATDAVYKRFRDYFGRAEFERTGALRKVALDTMDDNFNVDAKEWDRVQGAKVLGLRSLEVELQDDVKAAAVGKAAAAKSSVRLSYGLVGGVIVCSAFLAWIIASGIANSIGSLAGAAETVRKEKDFSVRAKKTSEDELGALTDAFNEMLSGIQARDSELTQHRENLEHLVEERTRALQKRNESMRMVLDNVEQGLATIKPNGRLESERSLAFDKFFGPPTKEAPFAELLAQQNKQVLSLLELGWEQVVEGFIPVDVAVELMPRFVEVGGRHFALDYKPIVEKEGLNGVLLVVSDITAEMERRRLDSEQRETIAVFERVMHDRAGFIEFFQECDSLVSQLTGPSSKDLVLLMRTVHTIKGNCAIFGVSSVEQVAHKLETSMTESQTLPSAAELELLIASWRILAERVRRLSGTEDEAIVEVAYQELDELLAAVAQHVPHPRIAERIERLKYERAVVRLKRVGDQAKALAQRLGKGKIAVEVIAANDVRFPSERWVPFWSNFVHVVRNAIGHGLEAPEERVAKGKGPGKLTLSAVSDSQYLTIEIRDDGRGVAWERVREKARERGLPHATQHDLIEALFADGVSTAESVNETSGRGVGMAAVRDATRAMSGNITIDSTAGAGTVIRFRFPIAATARRQGMSAHPGARPSINPIASDLAADSQERARNPATRLEGVG